MPSYSLACSWLQFVESLSTAFTWHNWKFRNITYFQPLWRSCTLKMAPYNSELWRWIQKVYPDYGRISPVAMTTEGDVQCYACLGLETWIAGAGTTQSASEADKAVKRLHYDTATLVKLRKIIDISNFTNILQLSEFKKLEEQIVDSNSTQSWMIVLLLENISLLLIFFSAARIWHWPSLAMWTKIPKLGACFRPYQLL